jgi:hypothetical protein
MNQYKTLWGSISILLGAVIAILALVHGSWQVWLLLGVFTIWSLWVVGIMLLPYMKQAKRRKLRRQQEELQQAQGIMANTFQIPEINDPVDQILLRHVNHRISAYLRAAYPDTKWEWCEKEPEKLVAHGGTGRIRVFGIPDFNYADVKLDQQAHINCAMVKIVPLAQMQNGTMDRSELPPNQQPVDPQIWYEVQGRQVLENLIADLHSRGHSNLTLKEDGNICIRQEDQEVSKDSFKSFPARVYWPRLVQVFEKEGLAASVTASGIEVSW